MLDLLKKNWWLLLVRGILAVVFGLAIFALDPFFPVPLVREIPFAILALLFGFFVLICGLLTGFASMRSFAYVNWALLVDGLLISAAGLVVLALPGLALEKVMYMIAGAALLAGIFEMAIAAALRRQIRHEWLLLTAGIGSAVFGIFLGLSAGDDIILVLRATCIYSLVSGSAMTAFAIRLRNLPPPLRAATA